MFERNAHTCYIPCFFYASDLLTILKFISIIPPRYIFMMTILYHISVSHGTQCSLLSTPWENFLTIYIFPDFFFCRNTSYAFKAYIYTDIILFLLCLYILSFYILLCLYILLYILLWSFLSPLMWHSTLYFHFSFLFSLSWVC